MKSEIKINYKNSLIEFDTDKEEWVAFFGDKNSLGDEFKRHSSLQKLKDAIDRFNKKEFKVIPILMFGTSYNNHGEMKNAEIISFTNVPGECWVKYHDGRREKINTIARGYSDGSKIYACGHIGNEPILAAILEEDSQIKKAEKELEQKKKKRIHLIDSLQVFDIGGYSEPETEI